MSAKPSEQAGLYPLRKPRRCCCIHRPPFSCRRILFTFDWFWPFVHLMILKLVPLTSSLRRPNASLIHKSKILSFSKSFVLLGYFWKLDEEEIVNKYEDNVKSSSRTSTISFFSLYFLFLSSLAVYWYISSATYHHYITVPPDHHIRNIMYTGNTIIVKNCTSEMVMMWVHSWLSSPLRIWVASGAFANSDPRCPLPLFPLCAWQMITFMMELKIQSTNTRSLWCQWH